MTDFRRPLHDETTPLHAALAPSLHRGCFDDEIAIDFPSIGAVVERMREGFLGDDAGGRRRAQVGDQPVAPTGVRRGDGPAGRAAAPHVPPLRRTRRDLGGTVRGVLGLGECSRPHQVRVLVPAGVTDGTRFRFLIAAPHGVPTRIEVTVLVA